MVNMIEAKTMAYNASKKAIIIGKLVVEMREAGRAMMKHLKNVPFEYWA